MLFCIGNCIHKPSSHQRRPLDTHKPDATPRFLRLTQHPKLSVAARITRHEQPSLGIPSQTCRSEATRAKTWSIALALLHSRIVEDVLGSCSTSQRLNWRIIPISTDFKLHGDKLETGNGIAVPATVVSDVHGGAVGIELAIDGCGVRE